MSNRESAEYRAFRRCFACLVDGITDPGWLAIQLYSKELIGPELREEAQKSAIEERVKIVKLLSAVENQIVTGPATKFREILNILQSELSLHHLATRLENAHNELCTRLISSPLPMSSPHLKYPQSSSVDANSCLPLLPAQEPRTVENEMIELQQTSPNLPGRAETSTSPPSTPSTISGHPSFPSSLEPCTVQRVTSSSRYHFLPQSDSVSSMPALTKTQQTSPREGGAQMSSAVTSSQVQKQSEDFPHENRQVNEKKESSIPQQVQEEFSVQQENVQLVAQLQHKEEIIKKLQEENQHLKQENQHLKQDKQHLLKELAIMKQKSELRLSWKKCRAAPCEMQRGSATECNNMAYFRPANSHQVYSYNSVTEKWSTLHPVCPKKEFTLTVVSGLVTAVGGKDLNKAYTNTLLSFKKGWRKMWVEQFQPMQIKRALSAVVCSDKTLVVAGGIAGDGKEKFVKLAVVEVMNTDTQQWSTVSSLPRPLFEASATVCGDSVYLVGRDDQQGYYTNTVFTCSLHTLLQSQTMMPLGRNCSVWTTIIDLPLKSSTCILNGQLLAVGGKYQNNDTNNIYAYNREARCWNVISQMPTCRFHCLVTVLPGNKLMVVGGETGHSEALDEVEIATD